MATKPQPEQRDIQVMTRYNVSLFNALTQFAQDKFEGNLSMAVRFIVSAQLTEKGYLK